MEIFTKSINDKWKLYILENNNGMQVHILNFGGIITKILVPDKNGVFENVVLGYKNLQDYEVNSNFFGAIIGRVAGRIAGASFKLEDHEFVLEKNEGENLLHSGKSGFQNVIWEGKPFKTDDEVGVELFYLSRNGDGGFPGNVKVTATYLLNNENQLIVRYNAETDQTTPITLTNHTYFNLTGNLKDTIINHKVKFNSHRFLELNSELIPTGKIRDTENTAFDFSKGRKLKDGMASNDIQNQIVGNGYDHYFLFNQGEKGQVVVKEETSGRVLKIETNQPGMVMYTGNNLDEKSELIEGKSRKYLGVCFETQGPPASLHHPNLPSIILNTNEQYKKETIYSFGVE